MKSRWTTSSFTSANEADHPAPIANAWVGCGRDSMPRCLTGTPLIPLSDGAPRLSRKEDPTCLHLAQELRSPGYLVAVYSVLPPAGGSMPGLCGAPRLESQKAAKPLQRRLRSSRGREVKPVAPRRPGGMGREELKGDQSPGLFVGHSRSLRSTVCRWARIADAAPPMSRFSIAVMIASCSAKLW